jgi:hypothetical protein
MSDVLDAVKDPAMRARLSEIQKRLQQGIPGVDAHHRLLGKPVVYHVIAGQTFEIVFSEVPSIDESEVLGVKQLIGEECYCRVTPRTAETLTVRFIMPLTGPDRRTSGR